MMYGRGFYGAGSACGFLGPVMMIGVIVLIAVLVYFLLKSNKAKSVESKPIDKEFMESVKNDSSAMSILKEKFAKGEITEEEYLTKKNLLERR